jgi:hypothetical protein
MKRYLHIKADIKLQLDHYQFTDETMCFDVNSDNDDLVKPQDGSYSLAGVFWFACNTNYYISIDLDIFLNLEYRKDHIGVDKLINDVLAIENRYKKIKNILG